ncbi:MAG TPA: hypothetical protein PLL72_21465 [Burkholderiaceae bacterium]|nr:hypothetical protein [Burkholderiaceae bacterium]
MHVPGVSVVVQQPVIAIAGAGAQAGAQSQAGATVFFGGGSSWYVDQGTPSVIQGLNVEGGQEMRRVSYQATRKITKRVIIQAVCIDDLRSRLGWGLVYQLEAPTEAQVRALLRREGDRRGVLLSDEVLDYLLSRSARDLSALMNLLDRLDHRALVAQRAITLPLVRQVLADPETA